MKIPAFQFYPGDWMKDPALRACSLAARGLWIDLLCLMWESPRRGYLVSASLRPYSVEQVARMAGCSPDEADGLYAELIDSGVASLTRSQILYNRRMAREELTRSRDRLRKGEQRKTSQDENSTHPCGGTGQDPRTSHESQIRKSRKSYTHQRNCPTVVPPDVTGLSGPSSSSSSSSKEEEELEKHTENSGGFTERAVCESPRGNPGDLFATWIGVFLAAGVKLSDRDRDKAARGTGNVPGFFSFDAAEQQRIVEYAIEKAKGTSARFMGFPVNMLDRREWARDGPGRVLPAPPTTKTGIAIRKASEEFIAENGG